MHAMPETSVRSSYPPARAAAESLYAAVASRTLAGVSLLAAKVGSAAASTASSATANGINLRTFMSFLASLQRFFQYRRIVRRRCAADQARLASASPNLGKTAT